MILTTGMILDLVKKNIKDIKHADTFNHPYFEGVILAKIYFHNGYGVSVIISNGANDALDRNEVGTIDLDGSIMDSNIIFDLDDIQDAIDHAKNYI